jgi:hypothetical protein
LAELPERNFPAEPKKPASTHPENNVSAIDTFGTTAAKFP